MKHAEQLIGRILFLECIQIASKLNQIKIGADIEKQLKNDQAAEEDAIKSYMELIIPHDLVLLIFSLILKLTNNRGPILS